MREFHHVFGDQHLHVGAGGELLAVPTNQRAREDLVAIGDHIEQEKDRLLNVVRLSVNIGNGSLPYNISFFYVSPPTESLLTLQENYVKGYAPRDTGQTLLIHVLVFQ